MNTKLVILLTIFLVLLLLWAMNRRKTTPTSETYRDFLKSDHGGGNMLLGPKKQ